VPNLSFEPCLLPASFITNRNGSSTNLGNKPTPRSFAPSSSHNSILLSPSGSPRNRHQFHSLHSDPNPDHEEFEMTQPYGATESHSHVEQENRDSEDAALLGGDTDTTVKRVSKPDGHATIVSCISNLANTIIGSGTCFH
jgi:hypothetical protein